MPRSGPRQVARGIEQRSEQHLEVKLGRQRPTRIEQTPEAVGVQLRTRVRRRRGHADQGRGRRGLVGDGRVAGARIRFIGLAI